jgi:2-iminobutanoate/2-iminopropanoate deaminase
MLKTIGPKTTHQISPAVVAGDMMYATNIPVDMKSGAFVGGPIETQARQVFQNLQTMLVEAGGDLANVVQLTVYLVDSKDLVGLNNVYKKFFSSEPYPSRATIIVRELVGPPGLRIETTAHAHLGAH